MPKMKQPEPILVLELFPELRRKLLELLASLAPQEWALPTACSEWSVKDVAAHLLGGDVGMLSRRRDAFTPPGKPPAHWGELVALINRLNREWVAAARRMSPRVLCDLLAHTGPQVEKYFASLDPFAIGVPVDWAGPERAPVWFDLAREYTERWHHQQQIREATGRPDLTERRLFAPVLDTFVRGLPYTFRDVQAPEGATVKLTVTGPAGGQWMLARERRTWRLCLAAGENASAEAAITQDDAWRLFTKGLGKEEARARATFLGDAALAAKALDLVAVIG